MGNGRSGFVLTGSGPQQVLIHSFQLDAEFDSCSFPWLCPRKQAMFHCPASLGSSIEQFLPIQKAKEILEELNKILQQTGFNPRISNPCFMIIIALNFLMVPLMPILFMEYKDFGVIFGLLGALGFVPWVFYFILLNYFKSSRRNRLTARVAEFNSSDTGVTLSLGGVGKTQYGVTIGSHEGGTYGNFTMATWDHMGLMFKGYLHVFVDTEKRQNWCRNKGVAYVQPTPRAPIQGETSFTQQPPGGYRPPPGYVLVPAIEQPPPGYALAPADTVHTLNNII